MKLAYRQACSEVIEVLKHTDYSIINNIPITFIKFLKVNSDMYYKSNIDFTSEDWASQIKPETGYLLSIMYRDYAINMRERAILMGLEEINKQDIMDRKAQFAKKEEESKTQKFTSNETLSKREPMDLALIDKVPWYKKLYKKIFKLFKNKEDRHAF
jgi:hypothetical protein